MHLSDPTKYKLGETKITNVLTDRPRDFCPKTKNSFAVGRASIIVLRVKRVRCQRLYTCSGASVYIDKSLSVWQYEVLSGTFSFSAIANIFKLFFF